ncbi:hypothetical protein GX411_05300 [Candidatus Fermentibacteria bacterium]|nr:hypothetical protein [Candidatus Fermentibacteria bacterium]
MAVAGSLESLREAEQRARLEVEKARQDAAGIRASIPREIRALEEEKRRHLERKRASAEERVRRSVAEAEAALRERTAAEIRALQDALPALERRAFEILRGSIASGREV